MLHIFIKNKTSEYLSTFGNLSILSREQLLDEMDRIWIQLRLNNKSSLASQSIAVGKFYSHPVWVLNGLFSDFNSVSKKHRIAIAEQIKRLEASRVADYGGGSGVLARSISEIAASAVDIIEPYPSDMFIEGLSKVANIKFLSALDKDYDVVIAQDVLEHVDNPLELTIQLICATRMNGYLIFANCFYPDIKCHLPSTFYLRHTFSNLMSYAGLSLIGRVSGAEHALVFRRIGPIQTVVFKTAAKRAKILGPILNMIWPFASKCKRIMNKLR